MTAAEIQAKIDAVEARIAEFNGVSESTFADRTARFDMDAAHKELARLNALLVQAASTIGSTTRYAATSKGC